jgi:hypothetical protein
MTYLLLGPAGDVCCSGVLAELEVRGRTTRLVSNLLAAPTRFAWRLDNSGSSSLLAPDDGPPLSENEIAGVLVRWDAWLDPGGWSLDDWTYAQTEAQSALLGWLWSLECPVINRYPPDSWYRQKAPLVYWQPILARCGLPTPEILGTNLPGEARAFGERSGAVYSPMLGETSYLLAGPEDWSSLEAMQRRAPVFLTRAHGAVRRACVVGPAIVWDGAPSDEARDLEPGMLRLSADSGLSFLELALASDVDSGGRLVVVAVETRPQVGHFVPAAQRAVIEGLVSLLEGRTTGPGAWPMPVRPRDDRQATTASI